MWYLISKNDPRVIYVLPGEDIIVGRHADGPNCNFAVPGDASLSRKHACFSVAENVLYLEDLGSKYGTFIKHSTDKLECNRKLSVEVNDIVKFGKMYCQWTVQKQNFITCTSTLKGEYVQNLKNILAKIGGILKSDWDDTCTYLTMPAITLTMKVVLALVQCAHIVTPDFWVKCYEAISRNSKLPDPTLFTPEIIESTLNKELVSFVPNEVRKSLFAGKVFIFFSKHQMEFFKMVLEKCSATGLLITDKKLTKSMLTAKDTIVIQYNLPPSQETESHREQIKDIVNYLKVKGKRTVADAEIGLAILYGSMAKYCNPDFHFGREVLNQPPYQDTKENNVLAQESQSQAVYREVKVKIEKSTTSNDNSLIASGNDDLVTGKRKLVEDDVTSNANKKIAIENTDQAIISTANKRTIEESDDIQTNPSKKMALMGGDDDSFNFIKSSNKKTENCTKTLNLIKPAKRKADQQDDEEGLFNFITKKVATEQNNVNGDSGDGNSELNIDENSNAETVNVNTTFISEKIDLNALRGSKLSELLEHNSKMGAKNKCMKVIISECNSEEFGSTVVIVRNDLIVKKEPLVVKEENLECSRLKNYKNFKKVWPLKIQESMSKPSLNV